MRKRLISFIAAVLLVLSSVLTASAAGSGVTLTIDQVTAEPGASVSVPVSVANNTGICGATISISYDSSLTLTDITAGSALSSLTMTKPGKLTANPFNIVWDGVDEDTTSGTIAVLTFTAPQESGTYAISASYADGDVLDGDLNPVDLTISNGAVVVGKEEPEPVENPFIDIYTTNYYYDAVLWAYSNGITTGRTQDDGTIIFMPTDTCTRAQAVTFLWRAMGQPEPETKTNPFTDVYTTNYYYKAVLWAYETGITTGKNPGSSQLLFGPNDFCTRGQIVTFLWRAEGKPGHTVANPFEDVADGGTFTNAILWAYENGITTGRTQGDGSIIFMPNDYCTRAQIVTFLYRDMVQ